MAQRDSGDGLDPSVDGVARPSPGAPAPPAGLTTRRAVALLAAIAVGAFLVRLVGVLIGAGLDSVLGFDDTVYFADTLALVGGRVPYRDFNFLHPPGILYLLSPFAIVGRFTDDATAFVLARLGMMALGAVNTFLVGLVGRRLGWGTALAAAALYAAWVVPAQWERTTYLVGPQATLLLLAMLALTGRGHAGLTPRRAAAAGICIGAAGAIQVWTVVPAAIIFGWLLLACRPALGRMVRVGAAYVIAGAATALALLAPFLLAAGREMIQMIIFAQVARTGGSGMGRVQRLRLLEGLPNGSHVAALFPPVLVIGVLLVVAALVLLVAWRRPQIRLWVAVLVGQFGFLMITPVFFPHYGGWAAPLAALSIGATAATLIGWLRRVQRRVAVVAYAAGLALLLVISLRPDGKPLPVTASTPDLRAARCVTADAPILLIRTGALRRDLDNGCPLLPNPKSLHHVFKADPGAVKAGRPAQAAYQQAWLDYFGASDAALFMRLDKDGLSAATWAAIKERLPFEQRVGPVTVLLREEP
jgi:hypothetical protein